MYTNSINVDDYQMRMLLGYFRCGMDQNIGVMEAFTRKLPVKRNFMVACGVERIMEYLHNFKFSIDDIKIIKEILNPSLIEPFSERDGNYLAGLSANVLKVRAMHDGDVLFANEPIIQVEGPIGMVQYVEKMILGMINHDVRIASKAARIVIASGDKPITEMGGRRAHEEATAAAARACYIAGFAGSSSVEAYVKYGVPHFGSMGHVWIMSHNVAGQTKRGSQQQSFKNFSKVYKNGTYLLDTYDTQDGAADATKCVAGNIGGGRLDSGDLNELSIAVRRAFNKADYCASAKVIATNDLNEYKILKLRKEGAYIDAFGVGTEVVCTPDSPSNNFVYKLVSIEDGKGNWKDVAKIAADGKATFPCAKQVRRYYDPSCNVFTHDEIIKRDTKLSPLSYDILYDRNVKTWNEAEWTTEMARNLFSKRLTEMPSFLKLIQSKIDDDMAHKYTVNISDDLLQAKQELMKAE